jgi:hypothetical protein
MLLAHFVQDVPGDAIEQVVKRTLDALSVDVQRNRAADRSSAIHEMTAITCSALIHSYFSEERENDGPRHWRTAW